MKIVRAQTNPAPISKDLPKNKITNYYILSDLPAMPLSKCVLKYPFNIDVEVFRSELNADNEEDNLPLYKGNILHVCLDHLTDKLYLPDIQSIKDVNNPKIKEATDRLMLVLSKKHQHFAMNAIIPGNPYNLFRIKKVSNFPHASEYIKENLIGNNGQFVDLVVAEINISKMPKTKELLGSYANFHSSFIGSGDTQIPLYNENNEWLYTLIPPVILINTSESVRISDASKDRLVVESYKTYLENQYSTSQRHSFRIKYLLYIGWSIKEICQEYFANMSTFNDIVGVGTAISNASAELSKKGYKNQYSDGDAFFFYSFPWTSNFNVKLIPNTTDSYTSNQPLAPLIDTMYDIKSNSVILKSRLYLPSKLLEKAFNISNVTISTYRPTQNILSSEKNLNETKTILSTINKDITQQGNQSPKFEIFNAEDPKLQFERKFISDYPQICDKIKNVCEVLSTPSQPIVFKDIEVIVGPLSKIQRGALGGYIDINRLRANGEKEPYQLFKGFILHPPTIIIDSVSRPSIADRYDTIMHEYRHYINMLLRIHSPDYKIDPSNIEAMLTYLKSPDEIHAHVQQAAYYIEIGMTKDQIVSKFLQQDNVLINSLPLAKEYSKFVDQAEDMLKKQKPIAESQKRSKKTKEEFEQREKASTDIVNAPENEDFDFILEKNN